MVTNKDGLFLTLAVFIPALLSPVPSVRAAQVYSNSFNGPVGTTYAEWSSSWCRSLASAITEQNVGCDGGCFLCVR